MANASPESKFFEYDFEISGTMPSPQMATFVEQQANMLNGRGWFEAVGEGVHKGHLEGEEETLLSFRNLMETAKFFLAGIETVTFTNPKAIEKCLGENFEARCINHRAETKL